jgi:hypothetical protein
MLNLAHQMGWRILSRWKSRADQLGRCAIDLGQLPVPVVRKKPINGNLIMFRAAA